MSPLIRPAIVLSVMLLPAGPVMAGAQYYGARLDQSQWVASGTRLQCSLSHDIPFYGTARFEGRTGGDLEFALQVLRLPDKAGTAQLAAVAPAWMHDTANTDLGAVTYAGDRIAFRFPHPLARRLLSELEKGMYPTLTYRDWADGRDQVTVALSAVNLRTGLAEFLRCLNALLPYDFDAVRETHVHFAFNSHTLSADAKAALDRVADYLHADQAVTSVKVMGFTDNVGFRRYNERLSRRRSEAVRAYLVHKGVKGVKFLLEAHGETRPAELNRTELGRSENRRVVVVLLK